MVTSAMLSKRLHLELKLLCFVPLTLFRFDMLVKKYKASFQRKIKRFKIWAMFMSFCCKHTNEPNGLQKPLICNWPREQIKNITGCFEFSIQANYGRGGGGMKHGIYRFERCLIHADQELISTVLKTLHPLASNLTKLGTTQLPGSSSLASQMPVMVQK